MKFEPINSTCLTHRNCTLYLLDMPNSVAMVHVRNLCQMEVGIQFNPIKYRAEVLDRLDAKSARILRHLTGSAWRSDYEPRN